MFFQLIFYEYKLNLCYFAVLQNRGNVFKSYREYWICGHTARFCWQHLQGNFLSNSFTISKHLLETEQYKTLAVRINIGLRKMTHYIYMFKYEMAVYTLIYACVYTSCDWAHLQAICFMSIKKVISLLNRCQTL